MLSCSDSYGFFSSSQVCKQNLHVHCLLGMHFIYTLAFVVPICFRVEGTKALEQINLVFVLCMQSKGFYEQSIVALSTF
jgi:hypothetical protein